MSISNEDYERYLEEFEEARKRIRRDRLIIKYVKKMVNTKHLTPNDVKTLNTLITEKSMV